MIQLAGKKVDKLWSSISNAGRPGFSSMTRCVNSKMGKVKSWTCWANGFVGVQIAAIDHLGTGIHELRLEKLVYKPRTIFGEWQWGSLHRKKWAKAWIYQGVKDHFWYYLLGVWMVWLSVVRQLYGSMYAFIFFYMNLLFHFVQSQPFRVSPFAHPLDFLNPAFHNGAPRPRRAGISGS